jgi:hypothetical protein
MKYQKTFIIFLLSLLISSTLVSAQNTTCIYFFYGDGCQHPFDNDIHKLSLDHIYSLLKSYDDFLRTGVKRIYTIDDIQPLCKSCNSTKQCKTKRFI